MLFPRVSILGHQIGASKAPGPKDSVGSPIGGLDGSMQKADRRSRRRRHILPPKGGSMEATKLKHLARFSVLLLLTGIAGGCSIGVGSPRQAPPLTYTAPPQSGFSTDTAITQMVTTQVGGKNVYIPSTVVVTEGTHTLSIFNTTDGPHGFQIDGINVEALLLPEEETEVVLKDLKGGNIYQIGCQLHPPHRTATLVVLKAR
jgi:hypothetical protein